MKAIVFATDHLDSDDRVDAPGSSFLNLQGRPILLYVLVALDQLTDIDQIVIVGPPTQIMRVLEAALFEVPFSKKITVLPQKGHLLDDLQSAIIGEPRQEPDLLHILPSGESEALLCLPGNIPLVTTAEIEAFLAASDMGRYDYCIGITEEDALRAFYPEGEKAGIKKPCIRLKDKSFRLNNLHLLHPLRIESVFQGQSANASKKNGRSVTGTNPLPPYMATLFEKLLSKGGQSREKVVSLSHPKHSIDMLEERLSLMSGLKLKFTGRWRGGAALNIDDADCYQAISERIDDWRTRVDGLNQTEEGKKQCPTSGLACKSE